MGPVIRHLRAFFPELPQPCADSALHWDFDAALTRIAPENFNKILPLHPILNVEYSILCNQLRQDFLNPQIEQRGQILERLKTALMFCELLEYIHQHYLVVPREVVRLRKQQQVFRTLLTELDGLSFSNHAAEKKELKVGFSLAQRTRDITVQSNQYRIMVNRSNRVINLLNTVITNSQGFNNFVANLNKYANPVLVYFGLFFHVPRLVTNLFLIAKHTVPGPWMKEEEASLAWSARLLSQIQRRWFEVGNDTTWTVVSAISLSLLVGASAAGAVYLSAAAFAFDVANAAARAFIELKRLNDLKKQYEAMLSEETNPEHQAVVKNHLEFIENRIHFERLRFGLHVSGTVLIFAAMAVALPIFAANPVVVLASALFLLMLWAITFALSQQLDKYRPNETIETTASVSKLGFFAAKKPTYEADYTKDYTPEPTTAPGSALSSNLEVEGVSISPALFI